MQRFTVSNDPAIYEAFPDVALTPSGRLVCVISECTHHSNRDFTRIMVTHSDDRGRAWSPKRSLTEPLRQNSKKDPFWNCPRISCLADGTLVAVVDRVAGRNPDCTGGRQEVLLWRSADEGESWAGPEETPLFGIVPDQLIELGSPSRRGRWLLAAHTVLPAPDGPVWTQRVWSSDDRGATWSAPVNVAADPGLRLCEGSIVELPEGELVCFMRENGGTGMDALKSVSTDGGESWGEPVLFPFPACHRPVAGMLSNGLLLVTHRLMQGGLGWIGWWTQNFVAGLTDVASCLAQTRDQAHTRILPVDFDRSAESDTGYSGWVQFPDGEIYVVNYILDDAPKAQIRGYAFRQSDVLLPASEA